MRKLLADALSERNEQHELTRVEVSEVLYKPMKRGLFRYRADFKDSSSGRHREQVFSAQLLRTGEAPVDARPESLDRYRAVKQRVIDTPVLHLPEQCLAVYMFPFDPLLPSLIDVLDPALIEAKLGEMWADAAIRVRDVSVRPLGFVPQLRVALGYSVLCESTKTGRSEMRQLVGKLDRKRDASQRHVLASALWEASQSRLRLARPVGVIPSLGLALQERVEGTRLGVLAGTDAFVGGARETASAIRVLHALRPPLAKECPPGKRDVSTIRRYGKLAAALDPRERLRIEHLSEALAAEVETRAEITGAVHGDLHPANVLVGDSGVTLIDTDNMWYGDPLSDVGRFLSSLRTSALRVHGTHAGLSAAADAFLEGYAADRRIDEPRVRMYEAASLLRSAGAPFRLQRSGWQNAMKSLVNEAERVFELAKPRATRASCVPERSGS